ncbi:MAG: alanine--tRNA ligase, partial [Nanoarchaeota archaeon]|nr:alanine--tRNA ligase [Nanoarchaeota archaeon]
FMKKYAPYAGILNLDEVDDIDKAWQIVADKVGTDVKTLKEKIEPMTGIFSIAEHARSLLFALNDGALPSNVGGGYNLRVLIRRALSFIDKFRWDIQLAEVCRWHAESLKPLFPELMENLKEIEKILEVERSKYEATKQKIEAIVSRLLEKDVMIDEDKLIELYDSEGINPGLIAEEAKKLGKKIEIPDNFFGKVAERHEKKEQEHATIKEDNLDLKEIEETEAMYYKDYDTTEFTAKVLKIIEKNIILDKTLFYPTSGGQMHDKGTINGLEVVDVFKQGAVIVHVIKEDALFKEGEEIEGILDFDRRKQLAQHHSAAHIVNAAAKRVLGNHINQAGAKKTEEKAHLDITHYQSVTQDEQQAIEDQANKIVEEKLPIYKTFMPRRKAEDKYGMRLYQGGAVPGKEIRVVEIPEVDVEACGGTHLNNTSEVGIIRIIKTTKVQDGIVRIVFTAGKATENLSSQEGEVLDKVAKLLNCDADQVPARVEELFSLWKKIVKKKKDIEFMLKSKERFEGDALVKSCEMLKTQPEHLINTIKRFLKEIEEVEAKKWK